jgi:RES domain-containing protein
MRVFRLCKRIYSDRVLAGEGGLAAEGRWHSAGHRIVYTASSEALAVLEMRVHVGRFIPKAAYAMHEMEVPDAQIRMLEGGMLKKRWNAVPPIGHTRHVGDKWLRENAAMALNVPSIHSATDRNILINPAHPAITKIALVRVGPYRFAITGCLMRQRPQDRGGADRAMSPIARRRRVTLNRANC